MPKDKYETLALGTGLWFNPAIKKSIWSKICLYRL